MQECKEQLEVDFGMEESLNKEISEDHILYLQEAVEVALDEEDCNEDSFYAADERYACDIYPRMVQVCDGPHAVQEVMIDQFGPAHSYIGPREMISLESETYAILEL